MRGDGRGARSCWSTASRPARGGPAPLRRVPRRGATPRRPARRRRHAGGRDPRRARRRGAARGAAAAAARCATTACDRAPDVLLLDVAGEGAGRAAGGARAARRSDRRALRARSPTRACTAARSQSPPCARWSTRWRQPQPAASGCAGARRRAVRALARGCCAALGVARRRRPAARCRRCRRCRAAAAARCTAACSRRDPHRSAAWARGRGGTRGVPPHRARRPTPTSTRRCDALARAPQLALLRRAGTQASVRRMSAHAARANIVAERGAVRGRPRRVRALRIGRRRSAPARRRRRVRALARRPAPSRRPAPTSRWRATPGHPIVHASWRGAPRRADRARLRPLRRPACRAAGGLAHAAVSRPSLDGDDLIGRGACDDKGPLLCHVAAIERHLTRRGRLPANVVCVFEGEEEHGSPAPARLPARARATARARRRRRLGHAHARPRAGRRSSRARAAQSRSRSSCRAAAVSCTPASSAAPSPNPLRGAVRDARGPARRARRIAVPGPLRPRAARSRARERARLAREAPADAELLADGGAAAAAGEAGFSAYERTTLRPALVGHRPRRRLHRARHAERGPGPCARAAEPAPRPRPGPGAGAQARSARACGRWRPRELRLARPRRARRRPRRRSTAATRPFARGGARTARRIRARTSIPALWRHRSRSSARSRRCSAPPSC